MQCIACLRVPVERKGQARSQADTGPAQETPQDQDACSLELHDISV